MGSDCISPVLSQSCQGRLWGRAALRMPGPGGAGKRTGSGLSWGGRCRPGRTCERSPGCSRCRAGPGSNRCFWGFRAGVLGPQLQNATDWLAKTQTRTVGKSQVAVWEGAPPSGRCDGGRHLSLAVAGHPGCSQASGSIAPCGLHLHTVFSLWATPSPSPKRTQSHWTKARPDGLILT